MAKNFTISPKRCKMKKLCTHKKFTNHPNSRKIRIFMRARLKKLIIKTKNDRFTCGFIKSTQLNIDTCNSRKKEYSNSCQEESKQKGLDMDKKFFAKHIAFQNVLNIRNSGVGYKPFYTDSFNISSGEISAMVYYNFIKPTGNTRVVFVPIDYKSILYRKCEAKEWQINIDECEKFLAEIASNITEMQDILNSWNNQ